MPSGNSPEEAQPWWSRPCGWMPSSCKGLRARCSLFPDLFALDNRPLFSKWRTARDLATQKSLQQKASLYSCLDIQQRAEVYGGLNACHTLCRCRPHLACFTLSSRKCRLHFSDTETEKKRSQSPRVVQLDCWWAFLLCPKQEEWRWGWIPPTMEACLTFHLGCFIPGNVPVLSWSPSPALEGGTEE